MGGGLSRGAAARLEALEDGDDAVAFLRALASRGRSSYTLAQALVDTAGLKTAQEVLGHAIVSTTARSYARVDEAAMVSAVAAAGEILDRPQTPAGDGTAATGGGFVFAYDPVTVSELEQAASGPSR